MKSEYRFQKRWNTSNPKKDIDKRDMKEESTMQ